MNLKLLKTGRSKLLVFTTHQLALPTLRLLRKSKPFPFNREQLHALPNGTLGKDLIHFIESKNLQLLTHYARHDLKHIVLGFDTTEEGELCLQSFMLGTGRISIPVLFTVFFGLSTAPEYWNAMLLSFYRGKEFKGIHAIDWFALVPQQTQIVRESIFNKHKSK